MSAHYSKTTRTPMLHDSPTKVFFKGTVASTQQHGYVTPSERPVVQLDYSSWPKALPLSTQRLASKQKWARDYMTLFPKLLFQWQEVKQRFVGFEERFIFNRAQKVLSDLLEQQPEYLQFNLTNECSVFFQTKIGDFNVYLELYFAADLPEKVEAVVNIYEDGTSVAAFSGSIQEAIEQIMQTVSVPYWETKAPYAFDFS